MLGRHVFMESLAANGVDRIFGNPGTTESPLIDSLADYPGIEYVVALHEGVALGAASYYAQASGRNTAVNLHVAPGLGNAIGMLYCALKANSPVLVTAGQQDTRMRLRAPVLGHDLVAMAAPVTKWSVQAESADELGLLLHRAFRVANEPPAGPVFVGLPINVMEQETALGAYSQENFIPPAGAHPEALARMAETLLGAESPVLVVGDDVARANSAEEVIGLAEALGATIFTEALRGHAAVPTQHSHVRGSLPVDAAQIGHALAGADVVLLLGGPFFEEVWFAPGTPFAESTRLLQIEASGTQLARNFAVEIGAVGHMGTAIATLLDEVLRRRHGDQVSRITTRNEAITVAADEARAKHLARVDRARDRRPLPMSVVMDLLAAAIPDGAVVVDESITASIDLERSFDLAGPGSFYSGRGGGIGQGLPGALGVALARPESPILCVSGDGSAMYSIQSLWTAARYALPIVFVILANSEYRILKHNLDSYRQRFETGSNQPYAHMDLTSPNLGFVEMAAGMGVPGTRVAEPDAFTDAVREAFAAGGPRLIEVAVEGKR
ncbi:MAG: thiamine pyrophosphate-binding protein [Pseudomonadota bacterium]